FQGVLGWFMVKSGLVDIPWVDPYRLTAHLMTALLLYVYILWIYLKVVVSDNGISNHSLWTFSKWITIVISVQIFFGGFMSGTHAALFAPTFPDIAGHMIPSGMFSLSPFWINIFENAPTLHFIHRGIAYILTVMIVVLWFKAIKEPGLKIPTSIMLVLLALQVTIGIMTLLNSVGEIPVVLASLHQIVAVLLLTSAVYLHFRLRVSD
ncbi:MAG: COX15/CtaA family protein, partial [Bacteroidetes bacterium]|nr:COX15/CtaA family protein [Bacteroidota bacterium]